MFTSSKWAGGMLLASVLTATSLTGPHVVPRAGSVSLASSGSGAVCSGGYVALTFDDGPDPAVTPRLLDELRRAGIRATFFTVGVNVQRNADIVRREAVEGHSVQDHSWDHPDLARMPTAAAVRQLVRGSHTVAAAGLPRPTFYRPPFDSTTKQLRDAAAGVGLTEVGYTVNTEDWKDPGVDRIVARADAVRAGGIVQMHDRGHPQTVDAIARIAADLRGRNMCFGRLEPTAEPNPDAPAWQQFYARAAPW